MKVFPLILCLANGFEYKMQQVSVWIEHRYATTEIGIWIRNTESTARTVSLAYDLRRSDYIHDLQALIGNERYSGEILERDEATDRCSKATKTDKTCVKVETSSINPKDINIYRKFNYEISIPANQELKVWLRYSSIIFLQDEKLTYTLNDYLQNSDSTKAKQEIFQVYISEIENIKGRPVVTCNGKKEVTLGTIQGDDGQDWVPEPWEWFGKFTAGEGQPGLCAPQVNSRGGGRGGGRNSRNRGRRRRAAGSRLASTSVSIQYEVERRETLKFVKGVPKYVEDHNGDVLIQDNHFIHIIHNKDIQTRPKKRIAFILDRSGSMRAKVAGTTSTRIQITVEALKTVLDQLHDGDEFNIISFSSRNNFSKMDAKMKKGTQTEINAAKAWLDRQQAGGMTYLGNPLQEAVDMCITGSSQLTNTIVVMTDGEFFDTGGVDKLISDAEKKVDARKAQLQINTISLGDNDYTNNMGRLSHAFQGTHMDISGSELKDVSKLLFKFYEKTSIPLFHNVQVNYTNVDAGDIFFENTVFTGQELMILGKLKQTCTPPVSDFFVGGEEVNQPEEIFVCSDGSGAAHFEFPQTDLSSFSNANAETSLELMFNYYKIMKQIRRLPADPSLRPVIIAAAKKYKFVTDLTSMYLEDSKEFITPAFTDSFGLGANGQRAAADATEGISIFETAEFCSDTSAFGAHFGSKVSYDFDITDIGDEDDVNAYFEMLIGDDDRPYYFDEAFVKYNPSTLEYDVTYYDNFNAACGDGDTDECDKLICQRERGMIVFTKAH